METSSELRGRRVSSASPSLYTQHIFKVFQCTLNKQAIGIWWSMWDVGVWRDVGHTRRMGITRESFDRRPYHIIVAASRRPHAHARAVAQNEIQSEKVITQQTHDIE